VNAMREKLEELKEAIDSFEELGLYRLSRVEPALDTVASALQPFFNDLPEELGPEMAVPLDALLAYLASKGTATELTARAATKILESVSTEHYEWERPDELNEDDRENLLEGLREIYDNLEAEHGNDDEGS
jgi:hypothetical protein